MSQRLAAALLLTLGGCIGVNEAGTLAPPAGLRARPLTLAVELSWELPGLRDADTVVYWGAAQGEPEGSVVLPAEETRHTVLSLEGGRAYAFWLTARAADGTESAPSPAVRATPLRSGVAPPELPEPDAGVPQPPEEDGGTLPSSEVDAGTLPVSEADAGTTMDGGLPPPPCAEVCAPPNTCGGGGFPGKCGNTNYPVVVTENGANRIHLFEPRVGNWSDAAALLWTWYPNAANGYPEPVAGWGSPNEVRLRNNPALGGNFLLVTDSTGLLAVVPYPAGGPRKWSSNVGAVPIPQAMEMLPDGNVAVVARVGNWVRLYASSQGPNATDFFEYPLVGAHGVLWDPARQWLWALGSADLIALTVGGTPAAPTLTLARRVALPTATGLDLQAVYGNVDALWVSTGTGVYQYRKSTNTFAASFTDAAAINLPGVRSIGSHPVTGQVLLTRPKAGNPCTTCTDTAEFFVRAATRTRTGAQFYKARFWVPEYQ